MIDYDYVECTSSALQALCLFRHMYPDHRRSEVARAIDRAVQYVLPLTPTRLPAVCLSHQCTLVV